MLTKLTERARVYLERSVPRVAADRLSRAREALRWIAKAHEAAGGKGVPVGYTAGRGWLPPYPEVSGYLLCTLRIIAEAGKNFDPEGVRLAETVAMGTTRWLTQDKFAQGHGFAGWEPSAQPSVELVFDTGQILHGLVSMAAWRPQACPAEKVRSTADWLCAMMDPDGGWTRGTFWKGPAQPYYLRVTWALLRAAKFLNDADLMRRSQKNFDHFLERFSADYWDGFLPRDQKQPYLTILHFYAYTAQAAIECAAALKSDGMLRVARSMLDYLAEFDLQHGGLPGRVDRFGNADRGFRCLTGEFQTAVCFHRFAMISSSSEHAELADRVLDRALKAAANGVWTGSVPRGGVWGSAPVHGRYQPWTQISWGAKFLIDAVLSSTEAARGVSPLIRGGELA